MYREQIDILLLLRDNKFQSENLIESKRSVQLMIVSRHLVCKSTNYDENKKEKKKRRDSAMQNG